MHTPSTVDRLDQEPLRFQGSTLEEAVRSARSALGERVRILEANRIRRGGIGGFFATDLGVEIVVVPEHSSMDESRGESMGESMDEALQRLVEQATELDTFAGALAREMTTPRPADDVPPIRPRRPRDHVVADPPTSPAGSLGVDPVIVLDQPRVERARTTAAPVQDVRRQTSSIEDDDIVITAEDILAELAELTELAELADLAELTDLTEPAVVAVVPEVPEVPEAPDAPEAPEAPEAPDHSEVSGNSGITGAAARPRHIHRARARRAPVVQRIATPAPEQPEEPPARQQIELAASAAGELVRQLAKGLDGAPQVTVKVAVTTADGSHVQAEAQLRSAK